MMFDAKLTRTMSILAFALTPCAPSVFAQTASNAPWTVALTATVNPLPIGGCGPVWLTLKDSTGKATPRDPQGRLITMADFDMTVASTNANAVIGQYSGASAWSACACQAATIGSAATITATYPARALAARARVPGVSFQSAAAITISAAKGSSNPAGCGTQNSVVGTLVGAPVIAMAMATPAAAPPATSSPLAPLGNTAASPSDPPGAGGTFAMMTIDSGSFVMKHVAGGSLVSEISTAGGVIARTGKVHYEPIVVDVQPGSPMDTWIDSAWAGSAMKKAGAIARTGVGSSAQTQATGSFTSAGQLLFANALISSTVIPTIDAQSSNYGYLRVTLTPASTSEGAGGLPPVAAPSKPKWLLSNFRLTLGNLDGSGVSRIESFVVATGDASGAALATGQVFHANLVYAGTVPSLLVTLSESSAAGWMAWYDDTVKGTGAPTEKSFVLELLASDLTTIARIKGSGVGIVSIRSIPVSNQTPPRVQVELYVKKIELLP